MVLDKRIDVQQTKTSQPRHMPRITLSLGLSLPKQPETRGFDSTSCLSTLFLLNSTIVPRDVVHDGFCQSSANLKLLLLRHKVVLDNIVRKSRALKERRSLQENFEPHPIRSVEELGSYP